MVLVYYKTKDLTIQMRGETVEAALEKVIAELKWYREYFPMRNYPKKPRKYSVYII